MGLLAHGCQPRCAVRRNHGIARTGRRIHRVFTPLPDGLRMPTATRALVLVTGEDCHLCEHGRKVLAELGVGAREIAVDSSEASVLAERGIPLAFLPVLTDGGRLIAYGRFSARRLTKDLGL